jgi:diaminopimelate epimerase
MRRLGDRRFGVGATSCWWSSRPTPGVDFRYRIFNGGAASEVEQCGNGARCFVRFVRDQGLTDQADTIRVRTVNNLLELRLQPDGRVTRRHERAVFAPARVPFDAAGLVPHAAGELWFEPMWPLAPSAAHA